MLAFFVYWNINSPSTIVLSGILGIPGLLVFSLLSPVLPPVLPPMLPPFTILTWYLDATSKLYLPSVVFSPSYSKLI